MPTYSTTAAAANYVAQGTLGVAGLYSTKRKYSLSDEIVWQDRRWALFDNILRQELRTMPVDDPEPKTLVNTEEPMKFSIASNATSSSGSKYDQLYVTNANSRFIQANDWLMCPNLECDYNASNYSATKGTYAPETMLVSSVVEGSTNATITVKRGNGYEPSTPTQITTSHYIVRMGHSLPDGSSAPIAIQYEPESFQTYLQLFSKTWSETETEGNTNVYGKMSLQEKAEKKRIQFMRELEFSHFFGRRGYKTVSGKRAWQAGGFQEAVPGSSANRGWYGNIAALDGTSRMIDMGGTFDVDTFREKMEIVFRYGSPDKVAFCGGKFFTVLTNALEKYVMVNDALSKKWGGMVSDIETGHGMLHLMRHPIFTEIDSSQTAWAYDLAIIDLQYVRLLAMKNMDIGVKATIEDEDEHLSKGEIYGQLGLWVQHPTAHAWVYGITG